ncbi:hypothetical protein niasHT_038626 [Heterodera trifolii]|uniref:Prolyl endopeptidase n=1 Tax=Heterodera trifolii TaxID=157864 RepID=A0ABD2IJM2_9BILA
MFLFPFLFCFCSAHFEFTHAQKQGEWSLKEQRKFWHHFQLKKEKHLSSTKSLIDDGDQQLTPQNGSNVEKKAASIFSPEDAYCESFNIDIHPDDYPSARRNESVLERICGQKVMDPYRWMEDPDRPETKQFVAEMNDLSRPFLEKAFFRAQFRNKMKQLFDQKAYGCITKHGDYYYYAYSEGTQKQSAIYRQQTLSGEKELFLDPNQFSSDGTAAIVQSAFTRDGQIMAYTVAEKGSDLSTIRFRDVKGNDLPDKIRNVKQSSLAWMPNNKGIFYSKYAQRKRATNETHVTKDEFHSLFYHRMGSKADKDVLIADFRELDDPTLSISGSVSRDGRFLFVYVYDKDSANTVYYLDLKAIDNKIQRKPALSLLIHDTRAFFIILDYDHESESALVLTDHTAPNRKLIRIGMSTAILGCAHWDTVIAEDPERTLDSVVPVAGDKLLVVYIEDVKTYLYVHHYATGKLIYRIPLGIGTVSQCYGDRDDVEAFFSFNSFLEPPTFYRADFSLVEKTSMLQLEQIRHSDEWRGVNLTGVTVSQEFFHSRDGTKVPIFIISRNDTKRDGSNPALLYGYGGFNIPLLPSYSSHRNIFVKHFHGVVAIANIRGGGEYGERWHECGARSHKQNVFDDFIGAAEFLIEQKYTSPRKLAIQGGSNGGLLVAACSQQRPELFGAVINQVGVMDMLRFHKFTVGSYWINEYGDPEKPEEFEYIYKYSPLHNIRLSRGTQWPATLLMTADQDDRVVPSHTLKYAAQLYHYLKKPEVKLTQRKPVIVRVETDAGHGAGKPRDKVIDELTDIMSFLQRVIQLKWYDD